VIPSSGLLPDLILELCYTLVHTAPCYIGNRFLQQISPFRVECASISSHLISLHKLVSHHVTLILVCISNDIVVTAPMDMLYRGVTGPITISDSGKGTKTTIEQKGFADSCVWSPYGNEDMVSAL
jgi:hypothetical protein